MMAAGPGEVSVMNGWSTERAPGIPAKATIAVTLLAVLLVAALPAVLLAAVIMMVLGYVIGGLALFGGTVLAAGLAVALAGLSGTRQLRKLLSAGSARVVRLSDAQYTDVTEPGGSEHGPVLQLKRGDYTEIS